jgi:hypothetical protein
MNKGKRKVQPKPLLYIDQPDYGDYDQQSEDYVVSQIKSTKEEKKEIIASEKVKEKATKLIGTEKEKEQPQKKVEKVKKKRSDRKSFKDMAVEEKVDFIINLPQQLPRLTAEIVTEEKKVRGLIYDRDDNIIKVRTYQAPYNEELTINEIQAINIVSL